jgi:hypothetical protein
MSRSDDEKISLTLHRYKNWVDAIRARDQEIMALRVQIDACTEQMMYAYLEAREEQERLIEMGVGKGAIDTVAVLPPMPFDPLVMVKRARASGT